MSADAESNNTGTQPWITPISMLIVGLLAILHAPTHIWASHRSLLSGQQALRNNALEYLEIELPDFWLAQK